MNRTVASGAALAMALCLVPQVSRAVEADSVEIGPLLIPPPAGWVSVQVKNQGTTFFDVDPRRGVPGCQISLVFAGFGANPRAFREGWQNAAADLKWNIKPPVPKEYKAPGGLTLSIGAVTFPPTTGKPDFAAVANLASNEFGQAFAAFGTRATCEPAFHTFVGAIVVRGEGPVSSSGRSSGPTGATPMSTIYANGRNDEQRRAAQSERDRQEQDRLAQQRAFDRQQQDRLAQQREFDRQQQNRLAQQREQDRIAQQRNR